MVPATLWVVFAFASSLLRAVHLGDLEFWARWSSIVIIDLTLAGDNALVIAMAARTLPRHQQTLGRIGGSLGGVILRLLFIVLVTFLLGVPFLQLAAGLVLFWIALKLIRHETGVEGRVRPGTTLLQAIWIMTLADVVMSLDNVLAVAAAAEGDYGLVLFGISLSLPCVLWGSQVLTQLMNRYPGIIWCGGGILGYVAGKLALKDPAIVEWVGQTIIDKVRYPLPLALGVTIIVLGWWSARASHGETPRKL